jgi:hypothetical protein
MEVPTENRPDVCASTLTLNVTEFTKLLYPPSIHDLSLLFEKIWQRMSPHLPYWVNGANLVCEKPSVCAFRKKFLKEGGNVDADHESRLAAVERFIKKTKLPVHHMLKDISFPSPDWSLYWDIAHLSKRKKQMNGECVIQKRKDLGIKYENYIWRCIVQQNAAQSAFEQSQTIHPPEEEKTHQISIINGVATLTEATPFAIVLLKSPSVSVSSQSHDQPREDQSNARHCDATRSSHDLSVHYTRNNDTLFSKRVGELQRTYMYHNSNSTANNFASASDPSPVGAVRTRESFLRNIENGAPARLLPISQTVQRYEPKTITWFLQGKLDGQCSRSDSAQVLPIEVKLRCKNGPWSGLDVHPHEILQNFAYEYLLNCDKGIIVEGKSCRVATQGTLSQPIIDMRSHQVNFDWVLFYRTYVPRIQRVLQYMLYLDGDERAKRDYFQCSRNGRTCLVGEAMQDGTVHPSEVAS